MSPTSSRLSSFRETSDFLDGLAVHLRRVHKTRLLSPSILKLTVLPLDDFLVLSIISKPVAYYTARPTTSLRPVLSSPRRSGKRLVLTLRNREKSLFVPVRDRDDGS